LYLNNGDHKIQVALFGKNKFKKKKINIGITVGVKGPACFLKIAAKSG
jgi:hypothetical protein